MYCIYIISASPLLLQLLPCPTLSHIPDFFILLLIIIVTSIQICTINYCYIIYYMIIL